MGGLWVFKELIDFEAVFGTEVISLSMNLIVLVVYDCYQTLYRVIYNFLNQSNAEQLC